MTLLLAIACYLGLAYVFLRQRRAIKRARRTDRHEAYLEMVTDWYTETSITDVALSRKVITQDGLLAALASLPRTTEKGVRALGAVLLKDRIVRRFAAAHIARTKGLTKMRSMRSLYKFLEGVRG